MPLSIKIPRVWVWTHISKKLSSTYMPLGKCFGPAAQQRSLKDGRWSGKSDLNLPSLPTTTQFHLRNYLMNETHISWEKDQFIPNWQSFNESRKSDLESKLPKWPYVKVMRWHEGSKCIPSFLYVHYICLWEEVTHNTFVEGNVESSFIYVSDLCSLATLPESVKWKAITGSAQFCQRDPNVRFTPSRVKSVNSEEVVKFLTLTSRADKEKYFFLLFILCRSHTFLWNCPKTIH